MSASHPVRLAIVMPLAEQRGGAERALLHYLDALSAGARAAVHLCFLEAGPMVEHCRCRGFDVAVIPGGRLRQPLAWLRCVRELRRWLRARRAQVVLSWLAKAQLYAGVAAWLEGIPALWWQHGLPQRWSIDALATLLPARGVLACSDAVAGAQRRLPGRRAAVHTVYPPVDLVAVRRVEARPPGRAALGLPSEPLIIGIVARLQRWKGVHVLLEAVASLPPATYGPVVVVVGGPHPLERGYAEEVRRLAVELGLGERVRFVGQQPNPLEWMAAMDVVVNASFGEPFGMVIVEALALGRPVVATRQAGPAEILTDGVDGLLVVPGDPTALAVALERLCRDPALRSRLGAAGRERAQAFGVERFVSGVEAALAAAVAP